MPANRPMMACPDEPLSTAMLPCRNENTQVGVAEPSGTVLDELRLIRQLLERLVELAEHVE